MERLFLSPSDSIRTPAPPAPNSGLMTPLPPISFTKENTRSGLAVTRVRGMWRAKWRA